MIFYSLKEIFEKVKPGVIRQFSELVFCDDFTAPTVPFHTGIWYTIYQKHGYACQDDEKIL